MATYKEFLVSGDCHIIEPPDLFKTRLPASMRDRALWEEEFTLEEPIVPGGHTEFRKLHTIGFDGWTVSKYRQFQGHCGRTPGWKPDEILDDMDMEGVDAAVFFPNLALFVAVHRRPRALHGARAGVERLGRGDLPAVQGPDAPGRRHPADRHPGRGGRDRAVVPSSACGR